MEESDIEGGVAQFEKGVEVLQEALDIDAETAVEVGSIQVEGPDARCGKLSVAEFLASDHGKEKGPQIIDMSKRHIDNGAEAEDAIALSLGFTAQRDAEGALVKDTPYSLDKVAESKKK